MSKFSYIAWEFYLNALLSEGSEEMKGILFPLNLILLSLSF